MKEKPDLATFIIILVGVVGVVGSIILIWSMLWFKIKMPPMESDIILPKGERLHSYSVEDDKIYYSTVPMSDKYEPKEYKIYVDNEHITTIIEVEDN